MAANFDALAVLKRIQSHAQVLIYTSVILHEPLNAPPTGTLAIWWVRSRSAPGLSGMDKTTLLIPFFARQYVDTAQGDEEAREAAILQSTLDFESELSADFTLGGTVRPGIDLLGMTGEGLISDAGYTDHSGTLYRTIDTQIPIIANDVHIQTDGA